MKIMNINKFIGEYRWLSNFWESPVEYEGKLYPTSEHAYQAAKTLDQDVREKIRLLKTPGETKRLGKKIELRKDWEEIKASVMYSIVLDKFTRNQDLRQKLIETGDKILIEGNTWGDKFWGVCNGVGENYLGMILMLVRERIR